MEKWGPGSSPDNDDDKVQQVPAVSDVGAGMHHQAVGQNLQEGLNCEDDEEDVLHLFLQHTEEEEYFQKNTSPCVVPQEDRSV